MLKLLKIYGSSGKLIFESKLNLFSSNQFFLSDMSWIIFLVLVGSFADFYFKEILKLDCKSIK